MTILVVPLVPLYLIVTCVLITTTCTCTCMGMYRYMYMYANIPQVSLEFYTNLNCLWYTNVLIAHDDNKHIHTFVQVQSCNVYVL